MTGSKVNEAYDKAKKCLDQLLSNDQIPFYGYVEIMLQLDAMKREESVIQVSMKDLTAEEKQHLFKVWKNASLNIIDERPHGKWIQRGIYNECSECKSGYMLSITEKCLDLDVFNYCPVCGADMRGNDNE